MFYVKYNVGILFPGYAKTPEYVAGEGVKVRKILIVIQSFIQNVYALSHFNNHIVFVILLHSKGLMLGYPEVRKT